jgi:regulator of RNase E activity RraA
MIRIPKDTLGSTIVTAKLQQMDGPIMELDEMCTRFRAIPTPVICDAMYDLGIPEQVLSNRLRPLLPTKRMVGAAFTLIGRAIVPHVGWDDGIPRMQPYLRIFEELESDSVIVSVNPDSAVGHFGELTANAAKARGCQGVILDGNLRDTEGLLRIGFQVFFSDLSPLNGIGRWEMAQKQIPVTIDGVSISPGDIIVGDFDGVIVVPRAEAERVLIEAESVDAAEAKVRAEAAEGISPMQSFERHGHI